MKYSIRITLAIIATLALFGYLGGQDVDRCIARGISADNCYATYNP